MARARGDRATRIWAINKVLKLTAAFEDTWWYGGDAESYMRIR